MAGQPKVTIVLSPPSMRLWFENLGDDFPWILSGLKENCSWMRWDRSKRAWTGSSQQFTAVLRYCGTVFEPNQIQVRWSNDSTVDNPRQLRMF